MRIISQDEAYSDEAGRKDLKRYFQQIDKFTRVATTDENFVIAVAESGVFAYNIYLLHNDEPVGFLYIETDRTRIYTPACYFLPKYRGRGLAKMLYRWLLTSGFCLTTEYSQSRYSHRLWKSLAKEFDLIVVGWGTDRVMYHGPKAIHNMCHKWGANILLANDMTVEQFAFRMDLEVRPLG